MSTHAPTPRDFVAHHETLEHPAEGAIRDAFARLPRRGCVEIHCRWDDRLPAQRVLAELGAFAVRLQPDEAFDTVRIAAFKGKAGACFDTGRRATYAGAALGVMDDDRHLIFGAIRVCEKTGGLYTLPPYRGLLTVTDADAGLLARLETAPVPFDCNTFEPDAERLAAQVFAGAAAGGDTTAVFYPGPFSLLVLRDGAIVRRGVCVRIASFLTGELRGRDGLLAVPPHRAAEAGAPVWYPAAFARLGAGCLMEAEVASAGTGGAALRAPVREVAPAAFSRCSAALRRRLLRLIERGEPYFILTGSDPGDARGCCPNALVGEANRLVDAGLLACHREVAAADTCSATVYALAGEISLQGGQPVFVVDARRRREAAEALRQAGSAGGSGTGPEPNQIA